MPASVISFNITLYCDTFWQLPVRLLLVDVDFALSIRKRLTQKRAFLCWSLWSPGSKSRSPVDPSRDILRFDVKINILYFRDSRLSLSHTGLPVKIKMPVLRFAGENEFNHELFKTTAIHRQLSEYKISRRQTRFLKSRLASTVCCFADHVVNHNSSTASRKNRNPCCLLPATHGRHPGTMISRLSQPPITLSFGG